jgi:hypothetical protein
VPGTPDNLCVRPWRLAARMQDEPEYEATAALDSQFEVVTGAVLLRSQLMTVADLVVILREATRRWTPEKY